MSGFIKLQRRFFDHWLWETSKTEPAMAFIDLLQIAAFVPTKRVVKGKLVTLEVGELIASERYLEKRWGWSRTKVRNFMNNLADDNMINRKKYHGETVITLCNYKEYALNEKSKVPPSRPVEYQSSTTDVPKIRSNKKEKNAEEEKKTSSAAASLPFIEELPKSQPKSQPDHTTPSLEQVLSKVSSVSFPPITKECATAYWNKRETVGWVLRGQLIVNWKADLNQFATYWVNNNRENGSIRHEVSRESIAEPKGWKCAHQSIYERPAPSSWQVVPTSKQQEIINYLENGNGSTSAA